MEIPPKGCPQASRIRRSIGNAEIGWHVAAGGWLCHTAAMFRSAVLDHFEHPRNSGTLADPTSVVEVSNPVCGDIFRLAVRVEGGRVTAARFQTRGCVTSIACSSLLTELIIGRSLEEIGGLTADRIAGELGGLEPATRHAADLALEAIEALRSRERR